jgi:hypothetical protein
MKKEMTETEKIYWILLERLKKLPKDQDYLVIKSEEVDRGKHGITIENIVEELVKISGGVSARLLREDGGMTTGNWEEHRDKPYFFGGGGWVSDADITKWIYNIDPDLLVNLPDEKDPREVARIVAKKSRKEGKEIIIEFYNYATLSDFLTKKLKNIDPSESIGKIDYKGFIFDFDKCIVLKNGSEILKMRVGSIKYKFLKALLSKIGTIITYKELATLKNTSELFSHSTQQETANIRKEFSRIHKDLGEKIFECNNGYIAQEE